MKDDIHITETENKLLTAAKILLIFFLIVGIVTISALVAITIMKFPWVVIGIITFLLVDAIVVFILVKILENKTAD